MHPVKIPGTLVFKLMDTHGLPLEIMMMTGEAVWDWEEFIRAALKSWKPRKVEKSVEEAAQLLRGSSESKALFLDCFRATLAKVLRAA